MSKADKLEYLPSADGKRVEVQIDPSLVAKSEKDTKTKETKVKKEEAQAHEKKELSVVDVIVDDGSKYDESTVKQILESLNKPQKGVKKEKVVAVKEKKVGHEKQF